MEPSVFDLREELLSIAVFLGLPMLLIAVANLIAAA